METLIKKVDRVCTIQEASQLKELGVDWIGISLSNEEIFNDDRNLTKETAVQIIEFLSFSSCVVEISVSNNLDEIIDFIIKSGIQYVQFSNCRIPSIEMRNKLYDNGIKIIYSGIAASYDDDPSWLLNPFLEERDTKNLSYYQVDLLGSIENSWNFLKFNCPNYEEDLQIDDINELAKVHPLLITLDYSRENINEIIKCFPYIKGITMTLGQNCLRNDIHCFNFHEVCDILSEI